MGRVLEGQSLSDAREVQAKTASSAAVTDLAYGALRRFGRDQAVLRALSARGQIEPGLRALLLVSLAALESGRYANYTVVDQAVHACVHLRKQRVQGFVNAILRAYLRERERLAPILEANPEARFQHPEWWIRRVREAYPVLWERVLEGGNTHPPMCVRVNRRRCDPEAYLVGLAACAIAARRAGHSALLLQKPVPVERLPGFAQGDVSVQDAGAQRAAELMDLAHGQRVLDACAAPGGKAAHILELADVELTALDIDPARCSTITQNLARLGMHAEVRAADCTLPGGWWDGRAYDRILADVPCTASGIARRRPDVKWLRRESDLAGFAARQYAIVSALWQTLAPGGKLLYVTCSIFPEENDGVVEAFLARTPEARRGQLVAGAPAQLVPDEGQDGFFFAILEKVC
ncbi:MAG: 16S rRNA (cytosine(967)-C(5))-methyltransferase RsmB [Betaproteobacteria bacterium]|nr:16S rRNA (cytosine(967)-C(5))-methyltransferase RsmB [Betaproteobacteria bacterium]